MKLLLWSIFPVTVLLALLLVFRRPLWLATLMASLLTWIIGTRVFLLDIPRTFDGIERGLQYAWRIGTILVAALLFSDVVRKRGSLTSLDRVIRDLAPEPSMQVVLVAYFFASFLECAAGFGTPALLMAPVLVSLGFSPVQSAVWPLLGSVAIIPFGAMGVPTVIGFEGYAIQPITENLAPLMFVLAFLIPSGLIYRVQKDRLGWNYSAFLSRMPMAILSGIFLATGFLAFSGWGPELCGICASVIGTILILSVLALRARHEGREFSVDWIKIAPFWTVAIALLASRLGARYGGWPNVSPAVILAVVSGVFIGTSRGLTKQFPTILKKLFKSSVRPLVTLVLICVFVQWAQLSGMIEAIAWPFRNRAFSFLAPFLGAFGTLSAGSSTISNMLLAPIQSANATVLGLPVFEALALQGMGSAIGVMISPPTLLGVATVLGLKDGERLLLRKNFWPCIILLAWTGVLGVFLGSR